MVRLPRIDNPGNDESGRSDHAHYPSKTRGAKRAQPRVDSINIEYPYTHFLSRFRVCPTIDVAGGTIKACCLPKPTEQEWLRLILQRVLPFLRTLVSCLVGAKIMAAADI